MCRTIRMLVLAAAAALGANAAQANLLINGDLENPPEHETDVAVGWTLEEPDVDANNDPVNSATFATFANHTPGGNRGLWLRPFVGGLNNDSPPTVTAHLYQDVPGVPGIVYSLTAWFRMEANYAGLNPADPTKTLLALDFLGVGDVILLSVALDVDTVYVPDNTWQPVHIGALAPAGTVTVRARASMLDGVFQPVNPQSAFVDDFLLLPEPTSATLLTLSGLFLLHYRRARPV